MTILKIVWKEIPQVTGKEGKNEWHRIFNSFVQVDRMKMKSKSNQRLRQLTTREVDELINLTILKPLTQPRIEKAEKKQVFNNWDLPEGPVGYRKARKNDPL